MTVPPAIPGPDVAERIMEAVDPGRLVETARALVDIPSPTGQELGAAQRLAELLSDAGTTAFLQHVEDGRANAVGTLEGDADGPTLMFNGHLDTSYSGKEPDRRGPGYQPHAQVIDGEIVGLGIGNMKGAVACYVEAVRALRDAGVRLAGDLVVAGVAGEIEKAQWGDDQGAEFRGYGAGTRYLVTHGIVADACVIGEPTGSALVPDHFGTLWVRIGVEGQSLHTAFAADQPGAHAVPVMRELLGDIEAWAKDWRERAAHGGRQATVNVGSIRGGAPWRLSRTPLRVDAFLDVRIPPTLPLPEARREVRQLVRELRNSYPDANISWESFVSVPGSAIPRDDPIVTAVAAAHEAVHGTAPAQDVVTWCSDASVLSRYDVPSLNYGPPATLSGPRGEAVRVEDLVAVAKVYALTAASLCGVAPTGVTEDGRPPR